MALQVALVPALESAESRTQAWDRWLIPAPVWSGNTRHPTLSAAQWSPNVANRKACTLAASFPRILLHMLDLIRLAPQFGVYESQEHISARASAL